MIKRNLQNEKLDQIGRRLLRAAKVGSGEIEKIVAAPHLFDSVKARINAEENARRKTKFFIGDWASSFVLNRQIMAGAFAIFIVLVTCAAAIIFQKPNLPQSAKQAITPAIQQQVPRRLTQLENTLPSSEIVETKLPAVKKQAAVDRIALKAEKTKLPNRVRKPEAAIVTPEAKEEAPEVFYSLTVAGNWEAGGEDLQLIRAELSKSELFALGINLPVENESSKVKTDLLVSADGVARAIRFVE